MQIGRDNYGNVQACPTFVTKVILKKVVQEAPGFESLEQRVAVLEDVLQRYNAQQATIDELRAENEKLLRENTELKQPVASAIDQGAYLQSRIDEIEDGEQRAKAQASLDNAELDEASNQIVVAETTDAERNGLRGGFILTSASDRALVRSVCFQQPDCGSGIAGWGAGFFVSGATSPSPLVSRTASLVFGGSGEMIFGSAQIGDDSSFLYSFAVRVGPRVRLGAPWGISFGVYYDFPLMLASNGALRFPLIGAAADLGIQYGMAKLTALYRYDFVHILYSDQRDLTFIGLGLTFINTHDGEGRSRMTFFD